MAVAVTRAAPVVYSHIAKEPDDCGGTGYAPKSRPWWWPSFSTSLGAAVSNGSPSFR